MDNKQKFYTVEQAAEMLHVHPESIRRYTRSGQLGSILLGNKYIRIPQEDLDSFLKQAKKELMDLPPVKAGSIWHSPLNVYFHIQKLTEQLGQAGLKKHSKYKLIREAQVTAVVALIMFRLRNIPAHLNLYIPDPPDALIMQPSNVKKGQLDISTIEITQYKGKEDESLIEQLKRTKVGPNLNTLSSFYVLIVDLWPGIVINNQELTELRDYLNENGIPYPVWIVQEIQSSPDTIAELTIVNPDLQKMTINIGESAFIYKQLKIPDVLHVKRTGNVDLVRIEKADKFEDPPWETIGK